MTGHIANTNGGILSVRDLQVTQFLKDHGFVLNVKNVTVSKFLHLFEKKVLLMK